MLVSICFKLAILAAGTWALFFRRSRATLPRVRLYRISVSIVTLVLLVAFWMFYLDHVMNEREVVRYKGLVQYALSLVDCFLFVHYLAVILLEIRPGQTQYFVKVLRSPDGESKGFAIGPMSVQRAAAWVLDKYYTEFPLYNPYLDRLTHGQGGARQRKNVKMYDIDGHGNNMNVSLQSPSTIFDLFIHPSFMFTGRKFDGGERGVKARLGNGPID